MIRTALMLATLSFALPAAAQVRTYGKETSIPFAASGGIRTFDPGPHAGAAVIYLQDRTLRWYQVKLTGPCFPTRAQDTAIYRTGPDGRLDRFSTIRSTRYADRSCGVTSVLRSDAPSGQPKVRAPTQRELR